MVRPWLAWVFLIFVVSILALTANTLNEWELDAVIALVLTGAFSAWFGYWALIRGRSKEATPEMVRIVAENVNTPGHSLWSVLPSQTLAEATLEVLELAYQEAKVNRHDYLGTEHLFLALLAERRQANIWVLSQWPCNLEELRDLLLDSPEGPRDEETDPQLTPRAFDVLLEAQDLAHRLHHARIRPEHLLLALLEDKESVFGSVLDELGLDSAGLYRMVLEDLHSTDGAIQEGKPPARPAPETGIQEGGRHSVPQPREE